VARLNQQVQTRTLKFVALEIIMLNICLRANERSFSLHKLKVN